jgi:hypothetical protein
MAVASTAMTGELSPKNTYDHEQRCAYIRRHRLIVAVPRNGALAAVTLLESHMGAQTLCRKGIYSADTTAPNRSFSTPLTRNAITAVANTNPSAITAVVASTRSKPPRP